MSTVIPASVKLAAKRGFVRTFTQALASVIPTSAITITLTGDWLAGIGLGAAGAIATAVLTGTASALMIISRGIPEEYTNAGIDQQFKEHSE